MADESHESIRRLEDRLSRASDAAERLISEAARTAMGDRPPPAGWEAPPAGSGTPVGRASEWDALVQALQALRELIPVDVMERLAAALRELLLALRALIDVYLERIGQGRKEPEQVQDIPIQ
jgi:hypothetical protein